MRSRRRCAAGAGAVGVALLLVVPFGSGAQAQDGPTLAGVSMAGVARGFQVNFAFQDFVLGNFVDVASPHASTELSSSGGGSSRAVASQLFPGDLVAGNKEARERIPGFREANYPANKDTKDIDKDDDTYTGPPATDAGPLTIELSHLKTHAGEAAASALVTTQRLELTGSAAPLLRMKSIETTSDAGGAGASVFDESRTIIHNLELVISDQLTIRIGEIDSHARSTSDGENGDASATFEISDLDVVLAGQHLRATIDDSGIKLIGAPEQVPSEIPQSLALEYQEILNQFGVSITASKPVKIVEGATADATVGGLLVSLRGAIPSVFTPEAVKTLYTQVLDAAGPITTREICPPDNPFTGCFTLQEICPTPTAPLCITPQIAPGPGQGFTTSFAIGLARASASAATPFEAGPGLPPGGFGGGPFGGGTGGFVSSPPGGGFVQTPTGPGAQPQPQQNAPRFGLVAKMPPGALLGAGGAFVAFALALALGPSLWPWRREARP